MIDELLNSDEQYAMCESEGFEPYLFKSSTGSVDFVEIEEEMEELNDFCVVSHKAVESALKKTRFQVERYEAGRDVLIVPDIGDVTDDAIMGLEDFEIPKWEHISFFLSHATSLVLLHIFAEKSLKSLCIALAPEGSRKAKREKDLSKIDSFLEYLRNTCKLTFDEPSGASKLRNGIRNIRNQFAHGDWVEVEKSTHMFGLRKSFATTTNLFEAIELATRKE